MSYFTDIVRQIQQRQSQLPVLQGLGGGSQFSPGPQPAVPYMPQAQFGPQTIAQPQPYGHGQMINPQTFGMQQPQFGQGQGQLGQQSPFGGQLGGGLVNPGTTPWGTPLSGNPWGLGGGMHSFPRPNIDPAPYPRPGVTIPAGAMNTGIRPNMDPSGIGSGAINLGMGTSGFATSMRPSFTSVTR